MQIFKGLYIITSGWSFRWKTVWKGQCFQRPESCHGSELGGRGEGLPSALLGLTPSWNTGEPAEGVEQIVPFFQKESCSEIWLGVRSKINTGLNARHFVALWKEKDSCRVDCLVLCIPPYPPRIGLHDTALQSRHILTSEAGLLSVAPLLLLDGIYELNFGSKTFPFIHVLWEKEWVYMSVCPLPPNYTSSTFVLRNEEQSRNQIRTVIPSWGCVGGRL